MNRLESSIQREIMLAASNAGMTIWRNNTGTAWQGNKMMLRDAIIILPSGQQIRIDRAVLLQNPRPVSFGLCPGSSDLIGIRPLVIGDEHLGQRIAQFVALEVKAKGKKPTEKQQQFLEFVEQRGGVSAIIRGVSDLEDYL